MYNNIKIRKIWDEDGLIELHIACDSEFMQAYQECYVQAKDLDSLKQ